jgi:hypothetical protein
MGEPSSRLPATTTIRMHAQGMKQPLLPLTQDDLQEETSTHATTKSLVVKSHGYLKSIYFQHCLQTFFQFVIAVCMVLAVVALYSDSKTLEKMATQGTQIMTTVQSILAEFQGTAALHTLKEMSAEWSTEYGPMAERVGATVVNTVTVVDDVIAQIVRGNTTALIREGLYEASLFVDTANHVLERLSVVFNISPHALEGIAGGT